MFVVTLYSLFRNIARSQRLAGIAVLIYSSNLSWPYFDSIFAYQTLALAFFGVALLAAWYFSYARTQEERTGWGAIATVSIAATVVTHHVTSYLLALTLVLVAFSSLLVKDRRAAARSGALALVAVMLIAIWLTTVAPQTVDYLWQQFAGIGQSFSSLVNGRLARAASTSSPARSV